MRALLDTHTLLWFLGGERALSQHARAVVEDPENIIFVSVASLWEIAIKVGVGKLDVGQPFTRFVHDQLTRTAFAVLGIEIRHPIFLSDLPLHHPEPFDRAAALPERSDRPADDGAAVPHRSRTPHSVRRAAIGSTRVARRAGM